MQFDKITARVSRLCYGLDPEHVDAAAITQKVISGVYQGVNTVELDNLVRRNATMTRLLPLVQVVRSLEYSLTNASLRQRKQLHT